MAEDYLLYRSVFTLFLGFLTFISMILNKIHLFFIGLDTYFVLFLFLGIIVSLFGVVMLFSWNFKNQTPYLNKIQVKKTHFTPYFLIGVFCLIIGFMFIFYIKGLSRIMFIASISVSIIGILMLIIGSVYFSKEVLYKKLNSGTLSHS